MTAGLPEERRNRVAVAVALTAPVLHALVLAARAAGVTPGCMLPSEPGVPCRQLIDGWPGGVMSRGESLCARSRGDESW